MPRVDRPTRDILICDLDGTLALDDHRSQHLHPKHDKLCAAFGVLPPSRVRQVMDTFRQEPLPGCDCGWKRDWDTYFGMCGDDKPNWSVIRLLQAVREKYWIQIFSGRVDTMREATIEWLNRYTVPYTVLKMRPAAERMDDHVMKVGWAKEQNIMDEIAFVLEDRKRVVEAWRAAGVSCFQVAPGDF